MIDTFDGYLAELATMTETDCTDADLMAELNAKYDLIQLGPVPEQGCLLA